MSNHNVQPNYTQPSSADGYFCFAAEENFNKFSCLIELILSSVSDMDQANLMQTNKKMHELVLATNNEKISKLQKAFSNALEQFRFTKTISIAPTFTSAYDALKCGTSLPEISDIIFNAVLKLDNIEHDENDEWAEYLLSTLCAPEKSSSIKDYFSQINKNDFLHYKISEDFSSMSKNLSMNSIFLNASILSILQKGFLEQEGVLETICKNLQHLTFCIQKYVQSFRRQSTNMSLEQEVVLALKPEQVREILPHLKLENLSTEQINNISREGNPHIAYELFKFIFEGDGERSQALLGSSKKFLLDVSCMCSSAMVEAFIKKHEYAKAVDSLQYVSTPIGYDARKRISSAISENAQNLIDVSNEGNNLLSKIPKEVLSYYVDSLKNL